MNNTIKPTHPYKWFSLIGLSLLGFTAFLDFTIVSTAIPFIQKSFNASILHLQWITTIFAMLTSMSMIAVGKLGDIWDRRLVFYLGFIVFAIAAVGAALSPSLNWLIFFRALQGFSAAIIFTQSAALLPQAFPSDQQHQAIGIYSMITGFGLAIGPFLGGIIIHFLDWRYIFWINLPIIAIGLLCCVFTLQAPPDAKKPSRFDWVGLLLLVVAIGSTIYGIILSEQIGLQHIAPPFFLGLGIIAWIIFIPYELHYPEPLLAISSFKNPYALLAILICCSAGIITLSYLFFNPLYFQIIRHYSPTAIGIILLAMPVMQVIVSALFPWLMKRIGLIKILIAGILLGAIAAISNSFFSTHTPLWMMVCTLMFMGFTWGAANTGSISLITDHFPSEQSGTVIGTLFTLWNITGSIILAIATVLFNHFQFSHLHNVLQRHKNALPSTDLNHLKQAILDPNHATSILHQTSSTSTHLYGLFATGFTFALQRTSMFIAGFLILILLIAFYIKYRLHEKKA